MKNELLYKTQELFNQIEGNSGNVTSVIPGVAYIEENKKSAFNYKIVNLLIIYDVDDISSETKIYNSSSVTTNLKEIIVDKKHVKKANVTNTYQFNTTGRHKILFRYTSLPQIPDSAFTGCQNIIGFSLPKSTNTIGRYAFANCNKLGPELEIGGLVTTIAQSAFQNCTGIIKLNVPSSSTTIENFAFNGCIGLHDVFVNTSVIAGAFNASGDGFGTIKIGGNLERPGGTINYSGCNYNEVIIEGDLINSCGYHYSASDNMEVLKIRGNYSHTEGNPPFLYTNNQVQYRDGKAHLTFIEAMGTIVGQINPNYDDRTIGRNWILHLGYDGIAGTPTDATVVGQNGTRLYKVYVGDGSSEEHDQEILDMYLADESWYAHSAKLDIWYNYHGKYREE